MHRKAKARTCDALEHGLKKVASVRQAWKAALELRRCDFSVRA